MTIYLGGIAVQGEMTKARSEHDFYPTEHEAIHAYFEYTTSQPALSHYYAARTVLDAGCGDGRWLAVYEKYYKPTRTYAVDVIERELTQLETPTYRVIADFTQLTPTTVDAVIGNPPFNLAAQFITTSFRWIAQEGIVTLLFPITILATKERKAIFDAYPVSQLIVFNTRVSFSGNGKTYPGREYCIINFIFKDGKSLSAKQAAREFDLDPLVHLTYER